LEAFYLTAASGRRFCLFHAPDRNVDVPAAIVFVHAFGEEMNKSRRMVALQARALADAGCAVLQIDLHGCGDSSGDFGEVSWDAWLEDVVRASAWLRDRSNAPFWFWGHRAGCLLATQAASRLDMAANFLFWQPVVSGKQYLQQFLRLKLAGELLGGDGKGVMEGLRRQLAEGRSVEIAGYALAPALAAGLEQAELTPPTKPCRMEWLELSSMPGATLTPVAQTHLSVWQTAGHLAQGRVVMGPAFWQTVEIEQCPALIDATVAAIRGGAP
jgi:exosortase A-associated hydrolase 2